MRTRKIAVRFLVWVNGVLQDAEVETPLPDTSISSALNVLITGFVPNNRRYNEFIFPTSRSTELVEYNKVSASLKLPHMCYSLTPTIW